MLSLHLDNDKAGMKQLEKLLDCLNLAKAKILNLPNGFKDPNDMLRNNKHKRACLANGITKTYIPSGV